MLFPKRTPVIIVALLAGFVVLLVIASNAFIASSIARMEETHAYAHLRSLLYTYRNELAGLSAQTNDWANWDDTYQFMADRNEEYLTSNYLPEMFQTLSLNLAVLTDLSGQVVFSMAYDAQADGGGEVPPPPSVWDGSLTSLLDPQQSLAGLLILPEGPLLFAAEPILTSDESGPSRGVLLFGRWPDREMIARFEGVTQSQITMALWDDSNLPADFASARQALSGTETVLVRALNDDYLAGYALLHDVSGNPAVILRTVNERDIYQYGQASRTLFTVLLLLFAGGTGLVIALLVWRMMDIGQGLSDILNGSADPIAVVSPDGTIQKVNAAFEAMCGLGQRSLLDVVCPQRPSQKEALRFKLQEAATRRTTQHLAEVSFWCPPLAHESVPFEVALSPIRARFGRSPHIIAALHDLTPQKKMEAHLRNALNREVEINRLKTHFLSMASHEFRTPLAVILSSAEILEHYWERQTEVERHKRLGKIKEAGQAMRQLSDNLLVHTRTEMGALEVRPEPVDINALCQGIIDDQLQTQDAEVPITFSPAPSSPVIQADPNLVTLIVRNLLSNAVKYSAAGKTVSLSIIQDAGQTVLAVRDEGIGIPLEEQPHLFTPFFRGSNVDALPGIGLGLPIVKQAVELQGGAISFESRPGQGSTFRVTLPHVTPPDSPKNGHGQSQTAPAQRPLEKP